MIFSSFFSLLLVATFDVHLVGAYATYRGDCGRTIEIGNCTEFTPTYGYDRDAGICVRFLYGGCNGNDNRFKTYADCKKMCHSSTKQDVPPTSLCDLPLEAGNCFAYMPSYGFDSAKGKCVLFIYGGCGGNSNNFETEAECEQQCPSSLPVTLPPPEVKTTVKPTHLCNQPLESGNCLAYFPSYGFDSAKGKCVMFIFGGCGGNTNRFETLAECNKRCPSLVPVPEPPKAPSAICDLPLEVGSCYAIFHPELNGWARPKKSKKGRLVLDSGCLLDGPFMGSWVLDPSLDILFFTFAS